MQYFHRSLVTGMRLRTAVITAVYQKAMRLTSSSRQGTTVGNVVNLMAVDAQRFADLTMFFHQLWSGPLQIGIAMYLLWGLVGISSLAGLAIMVLMIPFNAYLTKKAKALQVQQMKQKDARIKEVSEVLSGIKVIKLYAWEKPFIALVTAIRNTELQLLLRAGYLGAITQVSLYYHLISVQSCSFAKEKLLQAQIFSKEFLIDLTVGCVCMRSLPRIFSNFRSFHWFRKRSHSSRRIRRSCPIQSSTISAPNASPTFHNYHDHSGVRQACV